MKIAMIGQKTVPFIGGKGGGVERHVEELSARLVGMGHEVFAYSRRYLMPEKIQNFKGVKIIYTPSLPTKNLDTITHVLFSTLHAIFRRYDVIHFHGVGPSTVAWIPRLFSPRTRVIVTFHSIDRFHKKWGAFARWYLGHGEWTAVHYPHVTIAVSKSIQQYCRQMYNKETIYIPNGTDLRKSAEAHDNMIQRFGLGKDNYILTVARLIRHKGIHYLIEAYKMLENRHGADPKNWPGGKILKLAIVGAPSYTDDYLDFLKKLAADSTSIVFVGFQQGETLAQLFANAYLYVHPSEAEGLSITILEAMSYGTCVLVSNIPENLESIDHAGFAFESKNVNDLYEMMVYLMDFPESVKRHGEKCLNFIKKNFNWEDIAQEVAEVYAKR